MVHAFVVKVEEMAQMRPSELSVKQCVVYDTQHLPFKEIK